MCYHDNRSCWMLLSNEFCFLPSEFRNSSHLVNAIKLELAVCTEGHMLLCGQNLFLLGCATVTTILKNCGFRYCVHPVPRTKSLSSSVRCTLWIFACFKQTLCWTVRQPVVPLTTLMLVQPGFDPQCVTVTTGLIGCCLATNFVFCLPQMGQVSPETAVILLMLSSYSWWFVQLVTNYSVVKTFSFLVATVATIL